ncbi:MAG: septal ring lytic transglycosylase RlpA family protein [Treponema sp.]|jgi:rare lipoprotein A|nr:septal ring lytic transglycosylase RlpA family protein [Treponema sp.]
MKRFFGLIALFVPILMVPVFAHAQSSFQAEAGADVFRQEGIASWYGREFDGRPTASGEIFDSSQLTAAHPSLPFGTILVVTNRHNNKKVTVRINDRGPFVAARIIDVSRAAAEQLDMIVTGTAPVMVESIDRIVATPQMLPPSVPVQQAAVSTPQVLAPQPVVEVQPFTQISYTSQSLPQQAPQVVPQVYVQPVAAQVPSQFRLTPALNITPNKTYRLQLGSFKNARNAVETFDKLKNYGFNPAYERFTDSQNVEFFRVVLAGVQGTDVQITTDRLGAAGFKEALIREEN